MSTQESAETSDTLDLESLSKDERDELANGCAEIVRAVHEDRAINDVLDIDPEFIQQAEQMAYSLYMNDRLEEAEELILGVGSLDVNRYFPHMLLGDISMQQYEFEDAHAEFEEALEIQPDSAQTKIKLAEVKVRLGMHDEARELLNEVGPDADVSEKFQEWAETLRGLVGEE